MTKSEFVKFHYIINYNVGCDRVISIIIFFSSLNILEKPPSSNIIFLKCIFFKFYISILNTLFKVLYLCLALNIFIVICDIY